MGARASQTELGLNLSLTPDGDSNLNLLLSLPDVKFRESPKKILAKGHWALQGFHVCLGEGMPGARMK